MKQVAMWMLALSLGLGGTFTGYAFSEEEEDEVQVVAIKFAECPKAVQKTLTREARGAKIETVELESRDGRVVFEADVKIDGKNYEILVAADGILVAKTLDEDEEQDETELKLADCPAAVQKTLTREADGATIDKVDKMSKEGRFLFEIDVKIDGKNYEIVVTENGLLLSKEIDEEDESDDGKDSDKEDDEDDKKGKRDGDK